MSDHRQGRSPGAGDRDREDRRRALRIQRRMDFWELPDDNGGRAHRRSRVQPTRRRRRA
jgi:hypothetical protein